MTKCVSDQDIGTVIGLDTAITNCIRVISPFFGTFLVSLRGSYDIIGIACGILMSLSIAAQLRPVFSSEKHR